MKVQWAPVLCLCLFLCFLLPVSSEPEPHSIQRRQSNRRNSGFPLESGARYPDTGNLLLGREKNLSVSSTCGLQRKEKYCIVSHLEEKKKCFICHSVPYAQRELSHNIDNIVSKRRYKWWQAENGVENVYIQLDLEAEFHFTHLIITFKTFRPAAMLIERSSDFGKTWKVYRYFAHNCAETFPDIPKRIPINITDVVCEEKYSDVSPSSRGEIVFRVLPPHIKIENPYSPEVQNLLRMTNLRLNFTKLHTLGDNLLDNRREIEEKYYYAIYHMIVRGSCSCYGHADRCLPLGVHTGRFADDMVHGRCECIHNTTGLNCERCQDFHHDLPWKPAVGKHTNACHKCNCHDHAVACHFDEEVYNLSGGLSGGVCDNCLHNTMGNNCEQCIPYYYQDPQRDITDPQICRPCDCDTRGTVEDGLCSSRTDTANGLRSGQCKCRKNVTGRRCDRCKVGFWNFDPANPDGCQPCTCNTLGTIDNQGCDAFSGECRCKTFVTGRDCNECLAGHWGLSEDQDGCKPCDCALGASLNRNCNKTTGQCPCRLHAVGRRCDQTDQGFFAGLLNYLVYEAEYTDPSERCGEDLGCQVIMREPYHDGRSPYWTGPGFLKVGQDSFLNFTVDNLGTSMEYDVVLRYEPQHAGNWVDVRVIVDREGAVDLRGPCASSRVQDDYKQISLPYDSRYAIASTPACLEAGKQYKVRVEFRSYDSQGEPTPARASILIDSLVLVPHIDSLSSIFKSPRDKEEFQYYRCTQAYYEVMSASDMADICKHYFHDIGFYVFKEGRECECDPTGSTSSICDAIDGRCSCKNNIYGRRCDECYPGTYGFSPEGCTYCECDSTGSLNNLCNNVTGQCDCRSNTYGLTCNECQPGYWNFPNCIQCECNLHADTCDSRTGVCNDCRDNTGGPNCQRCSTGYYGDPRLGVGLACKACPCPGTVSDNHSFAKSCYLDQRTQNVNCECKRGYVGNRCDQCAENYFGNPLVPGGSCTPCNCSNNVVPSRPGNCNQTTGECLQCVFDTEGFHCERCKKGYFGDAIQKQCRECNCNRLGADNSTGTCDHETGQCHCLPNVIGETCSSCIANYWKIASGEGCIACECDPYGSLTERCNEYDGQCNCKPGFGGTKCNKCRENHWGDPRDQCHPCNCDPRGSLNLQCNYETGQCDCIHGVGGDKCNECARGFLGYSPRCQPCGECFDNWDAILVDLRDKTDNLVKAAEDVKKTGATGAYTKEFQSMEKKLVEIRSILRNATVSNEDLNDLEKEVQRLRDVLRDVLNELDTVNDEVDNTTQRIYLAKLLLNDLQNELSNLTSQVQTLKEDATSLQEAHLGGALNITKEALQRSQEAEDRARDTRRTIQNSQRQRQRTENLLRNAQQIHKQYHKDINKQLQEISSKITSISEQIPELNNHVCDNRGDPCDQFCGGAGCGKCGGLGCDEGAFTRSSTALRMAEDAKEMLENSQTDAEKRLREVTRAKSSADRAHDLAKMAHTLAVEAENTSQTIKQNFESVLSDINDFLKPEEDASTPEEIRILAEKILQKKVSLHPDQIRELASQINSTIDSLTNIDEILRDTEEDLSKANALKDRADQAKEDAIDVLGTANRVVAALEDAEKAQESATEAIKQATSDVAAARTDLVQISSETKAAGEKVDSTMEDIESMKARIKTLRERFIKNDRDVKNAESEATIALSVAEKATQKADSLEQAYNSVSSDLDERSNIASEARERAQQLQQRANTLAAEARKKLNELKDMKQEYDRHEGTLNDLSTELDILNQKMSSYLSFISSRAEHYRTCQR